MTFQYLSNTKNNSQWFLSFIQVFFDAATQAKLPLCLLPLAYHFPSRPQNEEMPCSIMSAFRPNAEDECDSFNAASRGVCHQQVARCLAVPWVTLLCKQQTKLQISMSSPQERDSWIYGCAVCGVFLTDGMSPMRSAMGHRVWGGYC